MGLNSPPTLIGLDAVQRRRKITNARLGALVGKSASRISKVRTGTVPATAELAKAIEQALGGEITRADLRPDIFDKAA